MAEVETGKPNVYQRLLQVRQQVGAIAKDAQTKSEGRFWYVSSNNILSTLRPLLDEAGLILECRVTGHKLYDKWRAEGQSGTKSQNEHLTEVTMEYVWVNVDDPQDRVVCPWYGQGLDTGEKGVGKALTYAEKYFLLKFFNIPTDDDDPDSGHSAAQTTKSSTSEPAQRQAAPTPSPAPTPQSVASPKPEHVARLEKSLKAARASEEAIVAAKQALGMTKKLREMDEAEASALYDKVLEIVSEQAPAAEEAAA